MLQFLQPVWLWITSGIIIPLVIHLWNIKQGKVLKVGSIAFLQNSSKQYAKSFKVNEWLLLLLRCLLIILASFLLAQPTWKKNTANKEKGWIIMDKQSFGIGYKTYKPLVDSLIKNDFSLHYLNEDFTAINLPDALKDTVLINDNSINYWDLILQLNKKIKVNIPIYIITDNQLKHFTGSRPIIEGNIHWLTFIESDSIEKHISKAFLTIHDSIRLIIGNSAPTANYYSIENLSNKIQSTTDFTTQFINGKLSVKYKTDSAILVDTSTLQITINAGQNANDVAYLKAAISAIQNLTNRKINLQIIRNQQELKAKQDWLFWLSEQPLPNNVDAKNIFTYANGTEIKTSSWINTTVSNIENNNIKLFKKIEPAIVSSASQTIWQDGFGNAILTKENNNQSNIYRFYNHFNPAWSNLVWENSFPTLLSSIIFNDDTTKILNDKRLIDETQIQPVLKATSNKNQTPIDENSKDISNFFWSSIFIIFLVERLVSFRTKKADA